MSELKRGAKGTIRLHLMDEAPRIGNGWRLVNYKVGNRHVRITNPHTHRTAKLPRNVFDMLVEASV